MLDSQAIDHITNQMNALRAELAEANARADKAELLAVELAGKLEAEKEAQRDKVWSFAFRIHHMEERGRKTEADLAEANSTIKHLTQLFALEVAKAAGK